MVKNCILIVLSVFFIKSIYSEEKPYGMIKIDGDKYIDETEIDVGSWLSYYTWILINEGYDAAQKVLPDSNVLEPLVWSYIKRKSTEYFDRPGAYTNLPIGYFESKCEDAMALEQRLYQTKECGIIYFPITGISYEQAIKFCKWRTKVIGKNKYIFRLPTPEEWKEMALIGMDNNERAKGIKDSIDKNRCATFNYKAECNCTPNCKLGVLLGVGSFMPEKSGLYEVFGNVSEMTLIKGIAKGGNFTLYANQCHVDSFQKYIKPEKWLGFRCIAFKKTKMTEKEEFQINDSESLIEDTNFNDEFGFFIDPRDGNKYPIVKIGNQVWMAKNLAYKPENGKYYVYSNDEIYVNYHGYLYTWETARNVCPVGWHLPSKEEFEQLLEYLGGINQSTYSKLRPYGNSGLSVLDCALRYGINFTPVEGGIAFWSSTERNKNNAWGLGFWTIKQTVNLYNTYQKGSGLPVRCIKD